jgi:hypothetical protein
MTTPRAAVFVLLTWLQEGKCTSQVSTWWLYWWAWCGLAQLFALVLAPLALPMLAAADERQP